MGDDGELIVACRDLFPCSTKDYGKLPIYVQTCCSDSRLLPRTLPPCLAGSTTYDSYLAGSYYLTTAA